MLKCVSKARTWSILVNVPCTLESSVCSAGVGGRWGDGGFLQTSAKPSWLVVWFRPPSVFLMFWLWGVSTLRRERWSFQLQLWICPFILLIIYPFSLISFYPIYLEAIFLGTYKFSIVVMSSWWIDPLSSHKVPLYSCFIFASFEAYLV